MVSFFMATSFVQAMEPSNADDLEKPSIPFSRRERSLENANSTVAPVPAFGRSLSARTSPVDDERDRDAVSVDGLSSYVASEDSSRKTASDQEHRSETFYAMTDLTLDPEEEVSDFSFDTDSLDSERVG